jgi:hypothetical protein
MLGVAELDLTQPLPLWESENFSISALSGFGRVKEFLKFCLDISALSAMLEAWVVDKACL